MVRGMAALEIDWLRSFAEAVETGGFGRAARRLNRTQSTVSLHIRQLEAAAGARLIDRGPRRFALTEAGAALSDYATRLLALHDEALARLRQPSLAGAATVAISEDFASRQMPRILGEFAAAHPQVRLEVRCGLGGPLRQALKRGEADLLIARRVGDAAPSSRMHVLWREALVWVAGGPVPDPALPLPLVLFGEGCVYRDTALAALKRAGRRWRVAYTGDALSGVQGAVQAGLGVTVLGRGAVIPGLRVLGTALPALPGSAIVLERRQRPSPAIDALARLIERRLSPARAVPEASAA